MGCGGEADLIAIGVVDEVIALKPSLAVDEVEPEELVEETNVLNKEVNVVIASADGTVKLQDGQAFLLTTQRLAVPTDRGQICALGVKVYVAWQ